MPEVTIDPMTRIEGHLAIKLKVEEGRVVDAYSMGMLWRGLERIVLGRDPRDAPIILSRICGVCHGVHRQTSILAIEHACMGKDYHPPDNAVRIRNIIEGIQEVWDHAAHLTVLCGPDFAVYGLAGKSCPGLRQPDWAPPVSRKTPSTKAPCLELDIDRYYQLLHKVILPAQKLGHEALAIFAGKVPHHMTALPGGVTVNPSPADVALAYVKMKELKGIVYDIYDYVWNDFIPHLIEEHPDVVELVSSIGVGVRNFLAYGVCPDPDNNYRNFLDGGVIFNYPVNKTPERVDLEEIEEQVKHSWYTDASGGKVARQPPPEPRYRKEGAYSWMKAPRYRGEPCEVGPLARMLINRKYTPISKYGASLVDRILARLEETKLYADAVLDWLLELARNLGKPVYDDRFKIRDGEGFGTWEPPRGALLHYIRIRDGKTAAYQCVVPTTWNASPRDAQGRRGPIEEALINAPIPYDKETGHYDVINAVRIVRSFDPCLACAIHLMTPSGRVQRVSVTPSLP